MTTAISAAYKEPLVDKLNIAAAERFHSPIMAACEKSYEMMRKHVEPSIEYYELRSKFDIRYQPPTPNEDKYYGPNYFYGSNSACRVKCNDLHLESQYHQYCATWHNEFNSDPEFCTKTTSYNFWNNNRSMHEELSKVALWWLAFPTSSIAAERSFAVSRLIDSSQRGRLGWKTISNELKLKVNKWVLKDLFKDALMKVPGMIVT